MCLQEGEHLTEHNFSLREEISKLEAEKVKLQAILRGHEPSCQSKLPPQQQQTSCYPQQQQPYNSFGMDMQHDSSSLLPLPDFSGSQQQIAPPPLKLEAFDEPYDQQVFYTNEPPQEPGTFLGVRTIGMTYLDLDSRCIAQ